MMFYDKATQWEQMAEWMIDVGTQTEQMGEKDVRGEVVGVVD